MSPLSKLLLSLNPYMRAAMNQRFRRIYSKTTNADRKARKTERQNKRLARGRH